MVAVAKKWGNSLAVRIPKDIAKTLKIEDNTKIELKVDGKVLIIEPKEELSLDDLVSKIDEKNLHDEIETVRVGREEW